MPLIVPVLAVVLGLAGCAGLGVEDVYRPPSLDHDQTRLTGLSWDSVQGRSRVIIDNPNAYGLPISAFDAELWLDGEPWLILDSPELSGLDAGATRVELDWSLALDGLIERSRAAYQAGQADLTLRLAPTLDVPVLGPRRLDWRHPISVPVPRAPSLRLTDWRVIDAGLGELALALELAVRNPNRFDLVAGPWELAVRAGDATLTRLSLDPWTLAAGASERRTARVTLGYDGLGSALLTGLIGGRWPADLTLDWRGAVRSPDLGLSLPPLSGQLSP